MLKINNRYARQEVLPELGVAGQAKLRAASVLCVGVGGLGSPALLYLAAAGIGRIGIVDDDLVAVSNLQRQVLFDEADVGVPKVVAAAKKLRALNSDCVIEPYQQRFSSTNAEYLLNKYDIIIDGTDNFISKYLLNDACVKFGKPLVYASILGFDAQVAVFWAKHGPCYRCLYPKPPSGHVPNCAEAGVLGGIAGIAGSVQAMEAIKLALGLDWCKNHGLQPLLGQLWQLNAKTMQILSLKLPKRSDCPACSVQSVIDLDQDHEVEIVAISAVEATKLLGKAIFIDVREQRELASGIISGALHLPLAELLAQNKTIAGLDSGAQIIVYCQHGIRSVTAARHLQKIGYGKVMHLAGGIVNGQYVAK